MPEATAHDAANHAPDAGRVTAASATPDAAPQAPLDAGSEIVRDAEPDVAPDVAQDAEPWFDDSRRLLGPNLFFAEPGVVLDTAGPARFLPTALQIWKHYAQDASAFSGFLLPKFVIRPHAGAVSLAFTAPIDQLFTATDINEWAWHRATWDLMPQAFESGSAPGSVAERALPPEPLPVAQAHAHFKARATAEAQPVRVALAQEAQRRGMACLIDDEALTLGLGETSATWPLNALPAPSDIDWSVLADIPAALVTGSNGKTTTVRLIAAMVRAAGLLPGLNNTGGVTIGDDTIARGDYAGPAGARLVLRDRRVQVAVLETARGGLLRRGLALAQARVAVVTNVSDDHFGEWGIDTLAHLAQAKLIVARAVQQAGILVLNADDAVLIQVAQSTADLPEPRRIALFALDDAHPALAALRAQGGSTCAVRAGHLWLKFDHTSPSASSARLQAHDLGPIAAMPLSLHGAARYNIANMAAAALAAFHLDLPPDAIARSLASFGANREDNPGRLARWHFGAPTPIAKDAASAAAFVNEHQALTVLVDYAHNPAGLRGLLTVAQALRKAGASDARLGVLLGQAGNRDDAALADLAAAAAEAWPERIVLKELAHLLRGREPGEVPAQLHAALLALGTPANCLHTVLDELQAARALLAWARSGDVLVVPIHSTPNLHTLIAWLDALAEQAWQPGQPLAALPELMPAPMQVQTQVSTPAPTPTPTERPA